MVHNRLDKLFVISIHAPREGRDGGGASGGCAIFAISIHAPREGRDRYSERYLPLGDEFQSTRPARGAT